MSILQPKNIKVITSITHNRPLSTFQAPTTKMMKTKIDKRRSLNSTFSSLSNFERYLTASTPKFEIRNKPKLSFTSSTPIIVRFLTNYGDKQLVEWGPIEPLNVEKHSIQVISTSLSAKMRKRGDKCQANVSDLPIEVEMYMKDGELFQNVKFLRMLAPSNCSKTCVKDVEVFYKRELVWKGTMSPDFGVVADFNTFLCSDEIKIWNENRIKESSMFPRLCDRFGVLPFPYRKELKISFLSNYSGTGTFTLTGMSIIVFDGENEKEIKKDDIDSISYECCDVEVGVEDFFEAKGNEPDNDLLDNQIKSNISLIASNSKDLTQSLRVQKLPTIFDEAEEESDDGTKGNNDFVINNSILAPTPTSETTMILHKTKVIKELFDADELKSIPKNPELRIKFIRPFVVKRIIFNNISQFGNEIYCTRNIVIRLDDNIAYSGRLKSNYIKNQNKIVAVENPAEYSTIITLNQSNNVRTV